MDKQGSNVGKKILNLHKKIKDSHFISYWLKPPVSPVWDDWDELPTMPRKTQTFEAMFIHKIMGIRLCFDGLINHSFQVQKNIKKRRISNVDTYKQRLITLRITFTNSINELLSLAESLIKINYQTSGEFRENIKYIKYVEECLMYAEQTYESINKTRTNLNHLNFEFLKVNIDDNSLNAIKQLMNEQDATIKALETVSKPGITLIEEMKDKYNKYQNLEE